MERLDGSLRGALREAGVPDAGALADVTRVWPETVGDAIARAAWPQRIARDGTLLVATVSSTWAFELGLLAEEILGKLVARVDKGAPTAIRFSPGPVPAPPAPPVAERAPAPPEADGATRALAAELTSAMTDAELRATIARAAAASLARAASDRRF
jgi:hypothetical protein